MIKLKELLKVIPSNTLIEITYHRKGRPTIIETGIPQDIKFRNQYIVEDVNPYSFILEIKVREKRGVK